MHQADVVFPFVVDHERRRVDEHFVEAVEPLEAQLQHRQAEQHRDARAVDRFKVQSLERHHALLLQKAGRQLGQARLLVCREVCQNRHIQSLLPFDIRIPGCFMCFPGPFDHRFARKLVT